MSKLFENTTLGAVDVQNRVFMAPLTRNRSNPDGTPVEMAAEYYAQRASGGLIISEATQVSPMGKGYLNTPGIHSADQIQAWKKITQAVHDKGGKIFMQLWHVGRISHVSLLPNGEKPVAPSAIKADSQTFTEDGMTDVSEPRALSAEEIKATVQDYRNAAQNAKDAGFDGVEVHAANGYLIDQFLQNKTNKRDDEYGGSVENRMRFLNEILDEVIDIWGADHVGVRLSPTGTFNDMGDSDVLGTFGTIIKKLNDYNLAYLHIVEKFPGINASAEERLLTGPLRGMWNGFYIANGDYDRDRAIEAIENGHADAITFGRIYIANPDLYERLKSNAELNEPDHDTFYGGGAEGYIDYPFMNEAKAA